MTRARRLISLATVAALLMTGLLATPAFALPGDVTGWVMMAPHGGVIRNTNAGEVIVHYAAEGESTLAPMTATTDTNGRWRLTGVTESRISQMRAEALVLLRGVLHRELDPELEEAPARPQGCVARRREAYYAAVATRHALGVRRLAGSDLDATA